jgi:hypothetical protein
MQTINKEPTNKITKCNTHKKNKIILLIKYTVILLEQIELI